MSVVIKNLHWAIVLFTIWTGWEMYAEFQEKKDLIDLRIPAAENKIRKALKDKKQLKQYFKDIETAKVKIEMVALQVEKLQKKLPNKISDAENLDMIKGIAENLNIRNVFLQPGIEENKGFYIAKKYSFQGTGTFLQFLIFMEKIGLSDRLLNIRKIAFVNNLKKQRGRFQLINCEASIEAYRYNPNHKEKRGIDEIAKDFKNKKRSKKPRKRKRRGKKK